MDRQKNMRQVEALIVEGIQQSIRSLLPVKTILREYLNDDEGEGEGAEDEEEGEAEVIATKEADVKPEAKAIETKPEPVVEVKPEPEPEPLPDITTQSVQAPKSSMKSTVTVNKEAGITAPVPEGQQTLVVDTEPTVSFTNMDTIFDSNNLEGNEITTHSMFEGGEVDRIETVDAPPEPLDDFEDLDGSGTAIDFEEITA
jgi:hypothetical protein